jgi:hypothetical protein
MEVDRTHRGVGFFGITTPSKTVLLSEWFTHDNMVGRSNYAWNVTPDKVFDAMPFVHGGDAASHIFWMDGHASLVRKDDLSLDDFLFR